MSDMPKPVSRVRTDDEDWEKAYCAAKASNGVPILEKLIESGMDPNIRNRFGCTPVMAAIKASSRKSIEYLAPLSDLSTASWHGRKPISLCMSSPRPAETLTILLEALKNAGKDVGAFITECDDFERVMQPPDSEARKVGGETPLHTVVCMRNMEILKILMELGGNANAKDRNGETVLMRAVEWGAEPEFDMLIEHGETRVDGATREGKTALHMALQIGMAREGFAKKLIEKGADTNMETQDKDTAMTYAIKSGCHELLEGILVVCDPFVIQSSNWHNGVGVLPERLTFNENVSEEMKAETIKVLQKKLDVMREKDKPDDGSPKKKKKKQG